MSVGKKRRRPERKIKHESVVLTDADRETLVEALLNPPAPSERLIDAMRRHRDLGMATDAPQGDLGQSVHRRFAKLGGVDLPRIPREPIRAQNDADPDVLPHHHRLADRGAHVRSPQNED